MFKNDGEVCVFLMDAVEEQTNPQYAGLTDEMSVAINKGIHPESDLKTLNIFNDDKEKITLCESGKYLVHKTFSLLDCISILKDKLDKKDNLVSDLKEEMSKKDEKIESLKKRNAKLADIAAGVPSLLKKVNLVKEECLEQANIIHTEEEECNDRNGQ